MDKKYNYSDKQIALNELYKRFEDKMSKREKEIRSLSSEELKKILSLD